MIRTPRSLLEAAALLLREDERDAVLGDLLEAGEDTARCLQGIAGLLVRRQFELWRDWRPWLAGGTALAGSLLLLAASFGLSVQARGAMVPMRLTLPLVHQGLLLIVWSWTAGCMVASLARKTWYASALLCAMPCLSCTLRFHLHAMSPFCVLLFLAPGLLGALRGRRHEAVSFVSAMALAIASTCLTLTWSGATACTLALVLPSWFLVANANPFQPKKEGLIA
jgi:hypothetical protein